MSSTDDHLAGTGWFKSPRSAGDSNCLEVNHLPDGHTEVRHSKDPDGLVLRFTAGMWSALLKTVATQPFPSGADWMLAQPADRFGAQARFLDCGIVEFTHGDAEAGERLTFTVGEWKAFTGGVSDGTMAWRAPEPQVAWAV